MKRWEDNIKEGREMGFGDSLGAAEDRKGWKGNVIYGAPTTSKVKVACLREQTLIQPQSNSSALQHMCRLLICIISSLRA